ncbi:hypothetical protein [Frankia gtarii]|uniref:hypothetical protein n=1 Tax=Frankia gtarii TaxID=2950102 RepID=UPI0021BEBB56|nr:hypothetical protein [Frankia gtarii]
MASRDRMLGWRSVAALLLLAALASSLLSALLCGSAEHSARGFEALGGASLVSVGERPHASSAVGAESHHDGEFHCPDRIADLVLLGATGLIPAVGSVFALAAAVFLLSALVLFVSGCPRLRRQTVAPDRLPCRLAQLCVLRT